MAAIRTREQEEIEDIFFGQIVIIWVRWFLIFGGAILVLWGATDQASLTYATIPIAIFMGTNFFFHGRYVNERPANRFMIQAAGIVDLLVIALFIMFWTNGGDNPVGTGLKSEFYIFLFPTILAFAFVFSPKVSMIHTSLALFTYAIACFIANPGFLLNDGNLDSIALETFASRLIIMVAMGGMGVYYWRIQRNRRRNLAPNK